MKGKNQRSVAQKANQEAHDRIAQLEAEVERLRDIENVGRLHVQALGEIERLNARIVDLERVAADVGKAERMLADATDRLSIAETVAARRAAALRRATNWVLGNVSVPGDVDINVAQAELLLDVYGIPSTPVPDPMRLAIIKKRHNRHGRLGVDGTKVLTDGTGFADWLIANVDNGHVCRDPLPSAVEA